MDSNKKQRLMTQKPTSKEEESGHGKKNAMMIHVSSMVIQQDDILLNCLKYLDTASLIQKKSISKQWQRFCTTAIDNKCDTTTKKKKKFHSNKELKDAVNKYLPGNYWNNNTRQCNPKDAEEIASTYGYPIDKWDVSNIKDFKALFCSKHYFNEPIGSWDVSNATTMYEMFWGANSFNQDISSWNVSNVTIMNGMFWVAREFNQDISSWDVSSVTDMRHMFSGAWSFNQDISTWDVSNVTDMRNMFKFATNFNNIDLSSWDVSNVTGFTSMFFRSGFDAEQLPWFNDIMLVQGTLYS